MMSLKDKYENYLQKKNEYEKEKYHYDSKEKELTQLVIDSLSQVDTDALQQLGYDFNLDVDMLNNSDYLIQKLNELKHIRDGLEARGQELLREY